MGKRKIPRSSLSKVKEQYRDIKKNEIEENKESADPLAVSLEDAKQIAHDTTVLETGYTPKELKKIKRNELKNIGKSFKSDKKIEAKWNFSIGDLVEFQDRHDKTMHIGIVIEFTKADHHGSRKHAKQDGNVLLYSSRGRIWQKPAAIRKVE